MSFDYYTDRGKREQNYCNLFPLLEHNNGNKKGGKRAHKQVLMRAKPWKCTFLVLCVKTLLSYFEQMKKKRQIGLWDILCRFI